MTESVDRSSKVLLVLGGTSDVGRATAAVFASRGYVIQMAGRDLEALDREAADVRARTGAAVSTHQFDALASSDFTTFIDRLPVLPDVVICVVGALGRQEEAERELQEAELILRTNFEGPALILGAFANRFAARGGGTIVGVSSVAGDRGRASNYVYGAAKAGFTAFLSGLRGRMSKCGVHVVTVKPGFIRSKMTMGLKLPPLVTAEPAEVGQSILSAVERNADVVYVKPIWRLIMSVISAIPERLFKKLSL